MIKCIIFDLCDTIVKTAGVNGLGRLNATPRNNEKMNHWFRSNSLFKAYERGEINVSSFANIFCAEFNIQDDKETFCRNYESLVLHEIDGVATIIKYWEKRLPLYALSNNNPLLWKGIQRCCNILDCFSEVFLSHETGLLKPETKAFQSALNAIDCRPEEVIFVDDNPECISAARELGFPSVRFVDATTATKKIERIITERLA